MKFATATLVLLVLAFPAWGQNPDARAAQAIASAESRLSALEARVDTLEQRAGLTAAPGKRSYADSYALALNRNLPLLAWNGTAVCAPCIEQTDGTEFVSFVGDVPGCPANAITVSVPEGGELVGAGVVDRWVGGDPQYGHLPLIRQILQRFRQKRMVTISGPVTAPPMFTAYQPAAFAGYGYGQPMMASYGSGGCATCGTATRGFLRR